MDEFEFARPMSSVKAAKRSSSAHFDLLEARQSSFVQRLTQESDYNDDDDDELLLFAGKTLELDYSLDLKQSLLSSVDMMKERTLKLQQARENNERHVNEINPDSDNQMTHWLSDNEVKTESEQQLLPLIAHKKRFVKGSRRRKLHVGREFWDKMLHPYQRLFEQEKRNRKLQASTENVN